MTEPDSSAYTAIEGASRSEGGVKEANEVVRPGRAFGLGGRGRQDVPARQGEPSGAPAAGASDADREAGGEATTGQTLAHQWAGVIRGLLFFLGLGVTTWGILIARAHGQFPWLPAELRAATARYLDNNQGVIVGGAVALVGAILVGLAARKAPEYGFAAGRSESRVSGPAMDDSRLGTLDSGPRSRRRLRRDPPAIGSLTLAALCTGLLYWQLVPAGRLYTHWDVLIFFASLAFTAYGVHRLDRVSVQTWDREVPSQLRLDRPPAPGAVGATAAPTAQTRGRIFTRLDWPAALLLGLFTAAVNMIELTRWDFAWVGDEGAFFLVARSMVAGNWAGSNFFSLSGVYDVHPVLDSVIQSVGIKLFGDDVFGWRMSEVLLLAVAAGLTYLAGVALLGDRLGRLPALAAAVVLGTNHYLMAFARVAYDHSHVVLYAALVLLMLGLAWRTRRAVAFLGLGMALGFCLYTFRTGVLIWPIVALAMAPSFLVQSPKSKVQSRHRETLDFVRAVREPPLRTLDLAKVGAALLGFLLVALPGFLVTPLDEFIRKSMMYTYAEQDPGRLFPIGLTDSMVSFWVNDRWQHHFVGGPLVDPVSGVLLAAGFFIALFRINRRVERVVLFLFAGAVVLVSLTRVGAEAHLTRLHLAVPGAALLVGLSVSAIYGMLRWTLRLWGPAAGAVVLALLIAIPPLNLYQLLVDSPTHLSQTTPSLMVKVLREHPDAPVIQVGATPMPDGNVTAVLLNLYPELRSRYGYVSFHGLANPSQERGARLPYFMVIREDEQVEASVTGILAKGYKKTRINDATNLDWLWLFEPLPRAPAAR